MCVCVCVCVMWMCKCVCAVVRAVVCVVVFALVFVVVCAVGCTVPVDEASLWYTLQYMLRLRYGTCCDPRDSTRTKSESARIISDSKCKELVVCSIVCYRSAIITDVIGWLHWYHIIALLGLCVVAIS